MDYDIATFFGAARPFIPNALLDGAGWDRLVDRVSGLPGWAVMSNVAAFEFRLRDSEPAGDFGTKIFRGSPLLDHYIEQGRASSAGAREAALGRFCSRMARSGGWPAGGMLEYDVWRVPPGERPDPGLFVNIAPLAQNPLNEAMPALGEALDALSDALGLERDIQERQAVESVCSAIPQAAFVNSVGAMPSRDIRSVRLVVEDVAGHEVAGFLRRIDFPGPIERVQEILADVLQTAPRLRLALDASPRGLLPRVGLELYPRVAGRGFAAWLHSQRHDWAPIVDHCIAQRWCLPDKGAALLDFPGLDPIFDTQGLLNLYRGIALVKITVSDRDVEVKAYAGMVFFEPAN